jgi:hypothetical protein
MAMANDLLPLPEHCPVDLRDLILRTLDTDPAKRPPSVRAFRDALEDYLGGAGRKRESQEMLEDVAREFESRGFAALGYEELTIMEQRLDQSLQLWPENADAAEFRQHLLALHAERAIEHKDLQLARTLVLGLPDYNDQRPYLLSRVMREEVAQDKAVVAQRKRRLLTNAMGVAMILGAVFVAYKSYQQAQAFKEAAIAYEKWKQTNEKLADATAVAKLLDAESKLASEVSRLAPLPHALDSREGQKQAKQIDVKAVDAFRQKREQLKKERASLGRSVAMAEPFELLLGEANLALNLAASPADMTKARDLYKEANRQRPEHPDPLTGIGIASAWLGQHDQAIQSLRAAGKATRDLKGPQHPDTANALTLAADATLKFGRQEDKQKELETYREILGIIEPIWAQHSLELSKHMERLGDEELALHYAKTALPIYERQDSKDAPPELADALIKIGRDHAKNRRHTDAAKMFLLALKMRRERLGNESADVAEAYRELARSLQQMGWREEALALMRQALKSSKAAYGEDDPRTLECARDLFLILAWPRGGPIPRRGRSPSHHGFGRLDRAAPDVHSSRERQRRH